LKVFLPVKRRGMILVLLLVVLLFSCFLGGLALYEVESSARVAQVHEDQVWGTNEALSALEKGKGWLRQEIVERGRLPRWLDQEGDGDGLLDAEEWIGSGEEALTVHSEAKPGKGLNVTMEVLDLDYRRTSALETAASLPPCLYEAYSLFGGTEMACPEGLGHIVELGDVSVSGDVAFTSKPDVPSLFSGEGKVFVPLRQDPSGHPLECANGEIRTSFRFSLIGGSAPGCLELGFRLHAAAQPEEVFKSGYSVAFCVEDPDHPENRDRLLLKKCGQGPATEVLASIPFPRCRSLNVQLQELYRAYLASGHELALHFVGNTVRVVLDPGKGTLEKSLETVIDDPANPEEGALLMGLAASPGPGTSLSVSSVRLHPADQKGYFPECERTGFYLVRACVVRDNRRRTFEMLISADCGSGRVDSLAWQEKPNS